MLLDVFAADGFTESSLTALINDQPHVPGRIGELGLFDEMRISTTTAQIERTNNTLNLVPNSPRGGVGDNVKADKRDLIPFNAPHLPQSATIMADEIQNLRAAGSESDEQAMTNYVAQRFAKMRRNIDATVEHHRIGAIKGQVLDADGSTVIVDLFTAFGISQTTHAMILGTASTKVRNKVVEAKRLVEDKLGGVALSGYRAFCGDEFFDKFISHDNVKAAFDRWEQGAALRDDMRSGFSFGGVTWENYRGKVGGTSFVPTAEAFLVPEGVADMFITRFAPADTMEFVNTLGLPYYAQQEVLRMNKGVELEAQSNPLNLCTRPQAVVKLTTN